MSGKVLIAGASGVVGAAAVPVFVEQGWDVVSLSRRVPETRPAAAITHLQVDLLDPVSSHAVLSSLSGLTHVVFAAVSETPGLVPGWFDQGQMKANLSMLQNCLEPLLDGSSKIEHVTIMQGTKAYGLHIHPLDIPARERSPRDPHENFYWLQEDYLIEAAKRSNFNYTIFRPPMVMGGAIAASMNVAPVLGVFAALCREEGRPFGFPGGPSYVTEALDARVLANAFIWAARSANARNQHFNITNGDVFEWRSLWPAIADALGVEVGADAPLSLATVLPQSEASWQRIVEKHRLRAIPLRTLLGESHHVTDFLFAQGSTDTPPPAFISTIKLRKAGFTEVLDTEDMFRYWLSDLIDRRILPPRL